MRDSSGKNPRPASGCFKKSGYLFKPIVSFRRQLPLSALREFCIPLDEFNSAFERRQRGLVRLDTKHALHPIIFADALMDHVLVRRSRSGLRSKLHITVCKLRPNRQCLYCFRAVTL